jgi:hypothetical protein
MIVWEMLHPQMRPDMLGLLIDWLDDDDPRPAREQFNSHYGHGGGWRPFSGFKLTPSNTLTYPEDPPLVPLARAFLREEMVLFYQHAWVAIVQPDRSFEACRMD